MILAFMFGILIGICLGVIIAFLYIYFMFDHFWTEFIEPELERRLLDLAWRHQP